MEKLFMHGQLHRELTDSNLHIDLRTVEGIKSGMTEEEWKMMAETCFPGWEVVGLTDKSTA